jgi:dihydrofolate synthase/folylpolyglutamate synthase
LITDDALAAVLTDIAAVEPLSGVTPSWFEIVTAVALAWFAEIPVDAAVVEVGLLGRFDATNVVDAQVAVITNIGGDHTDFSPGWREKVAGEKAGIVKPDSFLVLGETDPELLPIFAEAAGDRLWVREHDFEVLANRVAIGGRMIDVRTPGGSYDDLFVPAHGPHQGDNAALAIAAVEAFFARPLDEGVVVEAFERVRLPGRFEVVGRNPLVIVDGAHHAEAAGALLETLDDDFAIEGRRLYVVGMLAGRDPEVFLEAVGAGSADLLLACAPRWHRALAAADVGDAASSLGIPTEVVPAVADAVARAIDVADHDDVVVITGSFYVAGEARDALGLDPI